MKEIRNNIGKCEVRMAEDTQEKVIYGFALRFNSESNDLGGFVEVLAPDCLEGVIENSNVVALYNHDETNGILARSDKGVGTLHLEIREGEGLYFEYTCPNTTLGMDIYEMISRGDLPNNSFAFTCESDTWEHRPDGTYLRTINKIGKLFDISHVVTPAYSEPKTDVRGLNELKEKEESEAQAKIQEQEQYIADLRAQLK